MAGIGAVIWKIAVALYLFATGILGVGKGGDLNVIFGTINLSNSAFVMVAGVIALIAGVFLLLEMFNIQINILGTLILIIAIIWAVFTVLMFLYLIADFGWARLAQLAVYVMVCASLLIASGRFGK